FSQEWSSACLAHYLALLEQVGEAPDRVLSDYSLRGREPRWLPSDPTLPMPAHPREPVTARIVAQARATPDALAVTSGDRTWTYSQFMGHAQATARKLVEDGAGRGNVIA